MKLVGLLLWIHSSLACKYSYLPYFAKQIYPSWSTYRPAPSVAASSFFAPSCEDSSDFCNETRFYPAKQIAQAVQLEGSLLQALFDKPKPTQDSENKHRKGGNVDDINHKISGQEDTMENVCAAITNHIYR